MVDSGRGRLFVYGTLMPGESRWPVLEPVATAWSAATAAGTLYDTGHGYPGAAFGATDDEVIGVVVAIRPEHWADTVAALDELEGEGRLYRRIEVETSAGPATTYEWMGPVDGLLRLPAGWRRRERGQD